MSKVDTYEELLRKIVKEKRNTIIQLKKQIDEIEKLISKTNGETYVVSPFSCKSCGGEVEYNANNLLLVYPPKCFGKCKLCGTTNYISYVAFSEEKK